MEINMTDSVLSTHTYTHTLEGQLNQFVTINITKEKYIKYTSVARVLLFMMLFKLIVVREIMCIKLSISSFPVWGKSLLHCYLSSAVIRHAILSLKLDTTYPQFNQASQHQSRNQILVSKIESYKHTKQTQEQ